MYSLSFDLCQISLHLLQLKLDKDSMLRDVKKTLNSVDKSHNNKKFK